MVLFHQTSGSASVSPGFASAESMKKGMTAAAMMTASMTPHPLADCCVHGITQFPAPLTERDPLVTLLLKSKTGSTMRVTETDAVAPVEAWVSVRVKE